MYEENKETLALAFGAHGDGLLLAIEAPFSPKDSLPEKMSLRASFGNVDEKMTDSQDPGLIWATEVSLAGAPQTWHYGLISILIVLKQRVAYRSASLVSTHGSPLR